MEISKANVFSKIKIKRFIMQKLSIVAKLVVNSELKYSILESILKCAEQSKKEEGNIRYDVTEDISNPNIFIIIEEWASQEAIDFHNSSSHFKDLIEAISGKAEVSIHTSKLVS